MNGWTNRQTNWVTESLLQIFETHYSLFLNLISSSVCLFVGRNCSGYLFNMTIKIIWFHSLRGKFHWSLLFFQKLNFIFAYLVIQKWSRCSFIIFHDTCRIARVRHCQLWNNLKWQLVERLHIVTQLILSEALLAELLTISNHWNFCLNASNTGISFFSSKQNCILC